MNADTLQIVVIALTLGVVVSAARLASAYARRIGSRPPVDLPSRADTEELREQVQRLTSDMAELQERVDFTERLLARQRDAERLKG